MAAGEAPAPGELAFALVGKGAELRAHVPFEPTNDIFSLRCAPPPPGITIHVMPGIFQEICQKTGVGMLCSYEGNIASGNISPVEINVPILLSSMFKGGTYIVPTVYGTGLLKRTVKGSVVAPSITLPGAILDRIADRIVPTIICHSQAKPDAKAIQRYMAMITMYPGMLVTYRLMGLYSPKIVVELRIRTDAKGDLFIKFGILCLDGAYTRELSDETRAVVESSPTAESLFILDEDTGMFNAISLRDGTLLESITAIRKVGIPVVGQDGIVRIVDFEEYIKCHKIEGLAAELLRAVVLASPEKNPEDNKDNKDNDNDADADSDAE